jgi:hypothetical protein
MKIIKNLWNKIAYVTNDTAETSIKNHIHYFATPCETVICDCGGMTGDHISHQ